MKTILIYPSCRPEQIPFACYRARSTTSVRPLHIAVGYNGPQDINHSTDERRLVLETPEVRLCYGETLFDPPFVEACNILMKTAVMVFRPSDDDLIGYWSDDFYPEHGWLEALYAARQTSTRRFLCPYEHIMQSKVATIPFATWGWWREHMGGLLWPPILKYVVDVWVTEKAKMTGDFLSVPESRFEHKHHYSGRRPRDSVDNHNEPLGGPDWDIINKERESGFPVSWERFNG